MRTASQNRAEAQAALEPRAAFIVTSDNRGLVRKWLVAAGVSSETARSITLTNLQLIVRDETDQTLDFWRNGNTVATEATIATDASAPSIDAAIRGLIAASQVKAGVDESRVKALINEAIAEIGVIRHDVTITDASGIKVTEVKGAHKTFATLLRAMGSRQGDGRHPNIMLSGPTGSGKTHAVAQAAKAMGLEYYTNGAISEDYQLLGFRDAAGHYHETPFRKAFGRPATYLFDEFDSSQNSPLLALSGALANGRSEFPDALVERHPDCVIIAAGNTWGNGATADFVGRNKIDGAVRSRFPVRIAWDYDETLETAISGNAAWARRVQKARLLARRAGLKVIIDPRMTQAGAALIAAGMNETQAAELTYLADLSADQRRMLDTGEGANA